MSMSKQPITVTFPTIRLGTHITPGYTTTFIPPSPPMPPCGPVIPSNSPRTHITLLYCHHCTLPYDLLSTIHPAPTSRCLRCDHELCEQCWVTMFLKLYICWACDMDTHPPTFEWNWTCEWCNGMLDESRGVEWESRRLIGWSKRRWESKERVSEETVERGVRGVREAERIRRRKEEKEAA